MLSPVERGFGRKLPFNIVSESPWLQFVQIRPCAATVCHCRYAAGKSADVARGGGLLCQGTERTRRIG